MSSNAPNTVVPPVKKVINGLCFFCYISCACFFCFVFWGRVLLTLFCWLYFGMCGFIFSAQNRTNVHSTNHFLPYNFISVMFFFLCKSFVLLHKPSQTFIAFFLEKQKAFLFFIFYFFIFCFFFVCNFLF